MSRLPESVGVANDDDVLRRMRRSREAGHRRPVEHRRHQLRRRRDQLHTTRILPLLRRQPIICALCPIFYIIHTRWRCHFGHYCMPLSLLLVILTSRYRPLLATVLFLRHNSTCSQLSLRVFMAALRSRCGHYIFVLWFLLFLLFFFLSIFLILA